MLFGSSVAMCFGRSRVIKLKAKNQGYSDARKVENKKWGYQEWKKNESDLDDVANIAENKIIIVVGKMDRLGKEGEIRKDWFTEYGKQVITIWIVGILNG